MHKTSKKCPRCKQTLDGTFFNKNRRSCDGLQTYCRHCSKEKYRKKQVEYQRRPDVILRQKIYEQKSEVKIRKKAYMEKYRKTYVIPLELRERHNRKERERTKKPEVKKIIKQKSMEYRNRPEIRKREEEKRKTEKFRNRKKEYYEKWLSNDKVQEKLRNYRKRYYRKNKERIKDYQRSVPDKIKIWNRNHFNKRKQLGTTFLFGNPFPKEIQVDFHHFNKRLMIPMPRITHRFVNGHKKDITQHLNHNKKWIEKLYNLDVDSLIGGEIGNTRLSEDSRINFKEDMGNTGKE